MQDSKYDDFFDEEKGGTIQEKELLTMLHQYDKPLSQSIKAGAKVKGTVTRVSADSVFVSIDGKGEALLKASEVSDGQGGVTVKPGDTVEAFVAATTGGTVTLTMQMSGFSAGIAELQSARENRVPVQGKVTGVNKGGLQVKVMGHRGFCPLSFIDIKYVEDVNVYLNKTMTFVIDRITEGGRNIVLTRIPLLEEELWKKLDEIEKSIPDRKTYSGPITRIADFGLFVDMGGIEGLVHISEVSWERAENLAKTYAPGQIVDFVVLKIDRKDSIKNTKISLSMKQARPDPWTTVDARFSAGSQAPGKITRLAKFGAFVELVPGVEGLIPLSELSWNRRVNKPEEVVSAGQPVTVTILSVDAAARRISCSLKSLDEDPWKTVPERFPVGATVKGTVASQSNYGFFIDLADGVTGLLVNQNIAPEKKGEVKPKAEVEVTIDSLDTEQRRIGLSLGMAQIKADEQAVKEYMDKMRKKPLAAAEKPASEFGDLLKVALSKKK